VRLIDRLQRLGDAGALDRVLDLRTAAHPGRVDEQKTTSVALERHQDAVAGSAWLLARDHALLAQQAIDERRLADVRSADDGDADGAGFFALGRLRCEALQHARHELFAAAAVARGDGERLAEAEGVEVRGDHIGVEPLGLVECQGHGLARAAELARDELILWRKPGARVGDEYQPVRLLDCALRLGTHLRLDTARVLDEPTGIDDHVRDRAQPSKAVLAIARESGHIRDDRIPGAGEHVEQRRFTNVRPAYERDDGQHGGMAPASRRYGRGAGAALRLLSVAANGFAR